MADITLVSTVDLSKFSFSNEMVNAKKGKYLNFKYNNKKWMLQLPPMTSSTGLRQFDESSTPVLLLSLKDQDGVDSLFLSLESMIKDHIVQTSSLSIDEVNVRFSSIIKHHPPYPPSIGLKLRIDDHFLPTFSIFDADKNRINISSYDDLQQLFSKGVEIQTIVSCTSVWCAPRLYNIIMNVVSIQILQSSESTYKNEYLFV
jgi:hypothetical protein